MVVSTWATARVNAQYDLFCDRKKDNPLYGYSWKHSHNLELISTTRERKRDTERHERGEQEHIILVDEAITTLIDAPKFDCDASTKFFGASSNAYVLAVQAQV